MKAVSYQKILLFVLYNKVNLPIFSSKLQIYINIKTRTEKNIIVYAEEARYNKK